MGWMIVNCVRVAVTLWAISIGAGALAGGSSGGVDPAQATGASPAATTAPSSASASTATSHKSANLSSTSKHSSLSRTAQSKKASSSKRKSKARSSARATPKSKSKKASASKHTAKTPAAQAKSKKAAPKKSKKAAPTSQSTAAAAAAKGKDRPSTPQTNEAVTSAGQRLDDVAAPQATPSSATAETLADPRTPAGERPVLTEQGAAPILAPMTSDSSANARQSSSSLGTALAGGSSSPKGEEEWVELEVRWWFPTLSGSAQSSANGTTGTTVDFEQTLGIGTDKSFPWAKAALHFADRHRLWASYLGMRYTGGAVLTQSIAIAGGSFPAGAATQSEIELREIVGAYQYDLVKFSRGLLRLNLQAHYLDFDASVTGIGIGTAEEDFRVVVPTIGGGVDLWPFAWLKIGGDFNVFSLGVSGMRGELLDGQGGVTISPWDWLGVSAGYRYFKVIAKDTDANDRFDWFQKGLYGSITVRF